MACFSVVHIHGRQAPGFASLLLQALLVLPIRIGYKQAGKRILQLRIIFDEIRSRFRGAAYLSEQIFPQASVELGDA